MKKELIDKLNTIKISNSAKKIIINQIEVFYRIKKNYSTKDSNYNIGDNVTLDKGTIIHGTYKNMDGLRNIVKNGLISSWFFDGRISKYPGAVGVWNLKEKYLLKEYIDFYSGGTILYSGIFNKDIDTQKNLSKVIKYSDLNSLVDTVTKIDCHMWSMEQTKEARFLPSLVQNRVQIGIIFDSNNDEMRELLKNDILSLNMSDKKVRNFINPKYYKSFIENRKNKDDFFTDRESAILFGIPSCLIEGILVGREYEKNSELLKEIKELLPKAYICNLDGVVIKN